MKMKKVFLVFAVAVVVLFMVNSLALANDSNIPAAIKGIGDIRPLTDEECQKITSGSMIPPGAKRDIIEITNEELMLPPGVYWIFGGEKKFQALCLESTTFISLPGGVYTIYTAPQKSPAIEMMKKQL
jgi:hypothetical protein